MGRSGASVRVGYGEVGHIHNTSVHLHCMCLCTSLPPSPRPPCSLHCNDTAVCDRKEEEEDFQGEQHSVGGGGALEGAQSEVFFTGTRLLCDWRRPQSPGVMCGEVLAMLEEGQHLVVACLIVQLL